MLCYKCQREITQNSLVCPHCGAEMSVFARRRYTSGMSFSKGAPNSLPMNWFNFLIFFVLFADAVQSFISGLIYITGYDFSKEFGQSILWFTYLGKGYEAVDKIYGLFFVVMAVFAIITRNKLKNYQKSAPKMYITYLILPVAINTLYMLFYLILSKAEAVYFASLVTEIIPQALYVYLNYIYFKKRKHLFKEEKHEQQNS